MSVLIAPGDRPPREKRSSTRLRAFDALFDGDIQGFAIEWTQGFEIAKCPCSGVMRSIQPGLLSDGLSRYAGPYRESDACARSIPCLEALPRSYL